MYCSLLTRVQCTWGKEEDVARPATKQLVESLRVRQRELETEAANLRKQLEGANRNPDGVATKSKGASTNGHDRSPMVVAQIEEEYQGKSHLVVSDVSAISSTV